MGGEVVLYDGNDKLDPEKIKENFEEDAKVTVVLGELTRPDLLGVELSIISPGIPLDAPFVPVLDEAKIPIWVRSSWLTMWQRANSSPLPELTERPRPRL